MNCLGMTGIGHKKIQHSLSLSKKIIQLRKDQPVLQRRRFYQGKNQGKREDKADIYWFNPNGDIMRVDEWANTNHKVLGILINGEAINEMADDGTLLKGDSLIILINAHYEPIPFVLPEFAARSKWELLLNTADETSPPSFWTVKKPFQLDQRSLVIFRLETAPDA